ncbi:MAG: carbohydrate-binding domain-containing protein [Ruminococcaceae bacterium]|nr:carbohydrate-binding domain-containing protein [Oscillospiraceae bacterium]
MKRFKKALSVFLAFLMAFTVLPFAKWDTAAEAAELSDEYRLKVSGSYVYNLPSGVTAAQLMSSVYSTAVLKTSEGAVVDKTSSTVISTGMVLAYTNGEYTLVVVGDLSYDGACSAADLLIMRACIAKSYSDSLAVYAGDVSGDGIISSTDYAIYRKFLAGRCGINIDCYLSEEEKAAVVLGDPTVESGGTTEGGELADMASIHFDGDTVTATGTGVTVTGNCAYVTAAGNYTVTGSSDNGYVHVCAGTEDKVSLTLNNVSLTNTSGSALYFEQCKKAYITLPEGTASTLADGTVTTLADKGAVFSNDTLEINGGGALTVTGNRQHGIASDDDIIIDEASVTVTGAVKDSLHANDDISVNSGSLTVRSAGSDAVESEGTVNINGGTLTLTASAGTGLKAGTVFTSNGGTVNMLNCADGIKAGTELNVTDGVFNLSVTDNAMKSALVTNISGGEINVLSSDTGVKGDSEVNISGGVLTLNSSNNAIKSDLLVNISGGDLTLLSTGDGIKASSLDTAATAGEVRVSYTFSQLNGAVSTDGGCFVWNSGTVSNTAVYWYAALASSNGDGTYTVTQVVESGTAKNFTASADNIVLLTHINSTNYASACLVQVGDIISYSTSTMTVTATTGASYVGDINITGGNFYIEASYDATQAGETLSIDNSDTPRTSASGIGTSGEYNMYIVCAGGSDASVDTSTGSYKALKADNNILVQNIDLYASSPEDTVRSDVYVEINGGSFVIESGRDGIAATDGLCLGGGTFDITTGGGYSGTISSSDTNSYKGLKGNGYIVISGGTYSINSLDDAVHSNGACTVTNGTFTVYTGDDAFHSDTTMTVNGGTIDILASYEGIEGLNVSIMGGHISIQSSDDGINAAGGADGSGTAAPGRPGMGGMGSSSNTSQYSLKIGGSAFVWMNAKGDGADSNGSLTVSGGTLIVQQSQTNENSGIDADGTISVTGGVLVVVDLGNSMNSLSSSNFSQNALKGSFSGSANSLIALTDSSGNLLLAYKPTVSYSRVIISTPEMTTGSAYKLYVGGSCTGTADEGLYESGTYSAGTLKKSFTVSSTLYSF